MSMFCAPPAWRDVISRAVSLYGTPCYITRARPIEEARAEIEAAGHRGVVRHWLSVKTHPLHALISWWAGLRRGVEVVSEVELTTALSLGCAPSQLLVNGLAKHHWLPKFPLRDLRVHFDSPREVDALLPVALTNRWRVGVRLRAPGERDAQDPRFRGPFGMTEEEGVHSLSRLLEAGANVESIHFHLGQTPQEPDAYVRAVEYAAAVCRRARFRPRYMDCGGGLPSQEAAAGPLRDLALAVDTSFETFGPELEEVWLENGRYLLERATVLAVRVLDIKERPECRYLICDGGRTNQALAADKGMHALWLLPQRSAPLALTTICGPTCMTDDILGRVQLPASIGIGDVLVWTAAGAYHLPWETRFSHGLCAVAWCDEHDTLSLARSRERAESWMAPCH
jgi:diaminopimelate decarboxylase